jgi:hypothetical protein
MEIVSNVVPSNSLSQRACLLYSKMANMLVPATFRFLARYSLDDTLPPDKRSLPVLQAQKVEDHLAWNHQPLASKIARSLVAEMPRSIK